MMIENPISEVFVVPFRVLFLCTHNSSRSQMAEGLLRARGGNDFQVFSAGTHPGHVHPLAIKVMAELGIDISEHAGHYAKELGAFNDEPPMDFVVTICEKAAEMCPSVPKAHLQVHWGFPDPTDVAGTQQVRLATFRHIRDLIATRINLFLGTRKEHTNTLKKEASGLFMKNRGKKREAFP